MIRKLLKFLRLFIILTIVIIIVRLFCEYYIFLSTFVSKINQ